MKTWHRAQCPGFGSSPPLAFRGKLRSGSCRSPVPIDGDQSSGMMPITDSGKRAAAAGIAWPLKEEWDQQRLDETLFGGRQLPLRRPEHVLPDFSSLHEQLQQHLTLQLAWEEYRQVYPEGYSYSRFCELYGRWRRKQDVVPRQRMPVSRWHEQIGDPALADAILDRLVHNAHRIEMRGESMRKRDKQRQKGTKQPMLSVDRVGESSFLGRS